MSIQVVEMCRHCYKEITVTLNHVPEPRAQFKYLCPHCHEENLARFGAYIPHGTTLNTVVGVLVH